MTFHIENLPRPIVRDFFHDLLTPSVLYRLDDATAADLNDHRSIAASILRQPYVYVVSWGDCRNWLLNHWLHRDFGLPAKVWASRRDPVTNEPIFDDSEPSTCHWFRLSKPWRANDRPMRVFNSGSMAWYLPKDEARRIPLADGMRRMIFPPSDVVVEYGSNDPNKVWVYHDTLPDDFDGNRDIELVYDNDSDDEFDDNEAPPHPLAQD